MLQGAESILLFFDDAQDPAIDLLAAHPVVTCIACTDEFWADLGTDRSVRFPKRQNVALTHAYRNMREGWLLNVDCDEFLYFKDRTIAEAVAGFAGSIDTVRIRSAEAFGSDGSGAVHDFRLPMTRQEVRQVFDTDAGLFARRSGLVGHTEGKSLTRAGLDGVRLRQHWPEYPGRGPVQGDVLAAEDGAFLLHFADAGYERWRQKIDWRMQSSGIHPRVKARVEAALSSDDPEAELKALHGVLHDMNRDRKARLQALEKHLVVEADLDEMARTLFPGLPIG